MNFSPEQDQALIDGFLRNTLSDEDRRHFDLRMQDEAFKNKVEKMQALQRAVTSGGRENLRSEFRKWDRANGRPRVLSIRRIAAVAAALLVLAVFYFILPLNKGQATLASAYLEPYPNVVAPLQKGGSGSSTFEKAFQLYESGRYGKAEKIFATLDQANESVQFYRGVNYLLAGDDLEAMASLQNVIADPTHGYYKAALWYLSLAQINLGRTDEARVTLRHVVVGGPPYGDKAIELMNAL